MDEYSYHLYSNIIKILWRTFLIILGIAFLIVAFPYVKNIVMMFIISWLLATILNPLVDMIEGKGIHRGIAIALVMLIFIGVIVFSVSLVIPALLSAAESIIAKIQSNSISDFNAQLEVFFREKFNNPELASNVITKVNEIGVTLLSSLAKFFKNVGSILASIAIIPFIAFFLIKDMRLFKRAVISKVPNKYFELTLNILHKVGNQVSSYILGQALDALIIGCLTIIGLFFVNLAFDNPVPQFIFIGMVAGLANLIPYVGPIVGAIPALIIAIMSSPANLGLILIWIVITFALVQIVDNSLVSPMVVSKSVDMHPLLVVVVVLIGGNLAGAIGMLFAVPATGIINVTLREVAWGLKHYSLE